jgi:methionyl-tRNA synthetase
MRPASFSPVLICTPANLSATALRLDGARLLGNLSNVTLGIEQCPAIAVNYPKVLMPKPASKQKSAMETLVNSFSELVEDARERMSPQEFQKAEKKFDKIIDKAKARASRVGQRETA